MHRNKEIPLVIHKVEWERLKAQIEPPKKPVLHNKEYIDGLIAKSQEWMKKWPDTVQGHVALLSKTKEKQRAKDIATVKAFAKKVKKQNTEEAVKKARQMIFDDSCYGYQLISALTESKTLQERDVQLQFQKETKQKEKLLEQENIVKMNKDYFNIDKNESEKQSRRKQINLETANFNKAMYNFNTEKNIINKEKEKQLELEDAKYMKILLENEKLQNEKIKELEKQAVDEYKSEEEKIKELRRKEEKREEMLTKIWQNIDEKKRCKIQKVYKEIRKDRRDAPQAKINFELIKQSQDNAKRKLDEFIDVGIKRETERLLKKEEKNQKDQERKISIAKSQSVPDEATVSKAKRCREIRCSCCDRQTVVKLSKRSAKFRQQIGETKDTQSTPFYIRTNKLVQDLRRREKEPTPWNGLRATHEHFAQQANSALQECSYKNLVRKVIDDYTRINYLDPNTLPITNY